MVYTELAPRWQLAPRNNQSVLFKNDQSTFPLFVAIAVGKLILCLAVRSDYNGKLILCFAICSVHNRQTSFLFAAFTVGKLDFCFAVRSVHNWKTRYLCLFAWPYLVRTGLDQSTAPLSSFSPPFWLEWVTVLTVCGERVFNWCLSGFCYVNQLHAFRLPFPSLLESRHVVRYDTADIPREQTRTHTYTHTHAHARTRMHARTHSRTYTHTHTHTHTRARAHARTHAHARMHTHAARKHTCTEYKFSLSLSLSHSSKTMQFHADMEAAFGILKLGLHTNPTGHNR